LSATIPLDRSARAAALSFAALAKVLGDDERIIVVRRTWAHRVRENGMMETLSEKRLAYIARKR
jgi:hypothetical protein